MIVQCCMELPFEIASFRSSAFELSFQIFQSDLMSLVDRAELLLVPFSLFALRHHSDALGFDLFFALSTSGK